MLTDANKVNLIDYFSAITWSRWTTGYKDDEIIGHWAEDNSEYSIQCPHQLRDLLIEMQNILHDRYSEVERLRRELSEAERKAVL